jgi:hypothetical protein
MITTRITGLWPLMPLVQTDLAMGFLPNESETTGSPGLRGG